MKRDLWFLLGICLATIGLILLWPHANAVTSTDESVYLGAAYGAKSWRFVLSWPDMRITVPTFMSLLLRLRMGLPVIRLITPMFFMCLALIAVFALAKTLIGRKVAYIAAGVMFTLPLFWEIGNSTMIDIPLAGSMALFLLFCYLAVERSPKWFYLAAPCLLVCFLTKITGLLFVVPVVVYIVYRKQWRLFLGRHFLAAVVEGLTLFIVFYIGIRAGWSVSLMQQAELVRFNPYDFVRWGLAPILILVVPALFLKRTKEWVFLWLAVAGVVGFWTAERRFVDVRQYAPLYPVFCILIAMVIAKLVSTRRVWAYGIVGILAIPTVLNMVYINQYHETTAWGIMDVRAIIQKLDGAIGLDTESTARFLGATTDRNVVSAFTGLGQYPHWRPVYKLDGLDYVVLSIYGEDYRRQSPNPLHPKFCFITIPQVQVGVTTQLPPKVTPLSSDLYKFCESHYPRVATVSKGEQEVFVVYKTISPLQVIDGSKAWSD